MKQVLEVLQAPPPHWVGDGFPVRSLFSHGADGGGLSPFLLLDHAGPAHFPPATRRRGVGAHPHRGFETVTIVYQGEVDHRDSTGAGGHVGPGDVQWMTAASGLLHEEFHSDAFTRRGGTLEMAQLWVNLPAREKGAPPAYQTLTSAQIPVVELPEGAGRVRVIAGELRGAKGPARTRTPMSTWDVELKAGRRAELPAPEGWTAAVVVLHGAVRVGPGDTVEDGRVVVLARQGSGVTIEAVTDAKLLFLAGEPIDEPVAAHGPFVMNTREEIAQAIADYQGGRFGRIPD